MAHVWWAAPADCEGLVIPVRVWSDVKMVTLQAQVVPHDGSPPVLLSGATDRLDGGVSVVRFDDGRELLVAREHLETVFDE